jgi:hypothetical protein
VLADESGQFWVPRFGVMALVEYMDATGLRAIPVAEVMTYSYDFVAGSRNLPKVGDPVWINLETSTWHGRKGEFLRGVATSHRHEYFGVVRIDGEEQGFGPCLAPWVRS